MGGASRYLDNHLRPGNRVLVQIVAVNPHAAAPTGGHPKRGGNTHTLHTALSAPPQSTKQTAGAHNLLQPSLQYTGWLVGGSFKRRRWCRTHLAKISTSRGLVTRSATRSWSGVPVAAASLRYKISRYNMTESGNRAGPWFMAHLAAEATWQVSPPAPARLTGLRAGLRRLCGAP